MRETLEKPIRDLRPIHYVGNKLRVLDQIQSAVSRLVPERSPACDLFAGTGVVSRRLCETRPIVSSDIQYYSQILTTALTRPRRYSCKSTVSILRRAEAWFDEHYEAYKGLIDLESDAHNIVKSEPDPLAKIIEFGSLAVPAIGETQFENLKHETRRAKGSKDAVLAWHYGGVYFSYRQALELDALRVAIRSYNGERREPTAVAALLGTASDIVTTVGNHFAQPIRPKTADGKVKTSWVPGTLRRRSLSVFEIFKSWLQRYAQLPPTEFPCETIHADYRTTLSMLSPEIGVVYADPPYTRDHYSRFYHVLETIALDDQPGISRSPSTGAPSRGLYRENRHQSPFGIRTQVWPAFTHLIESVANLDAALVLSYSPMSAGTTFRPETRLVAVSDLIDLVHRYYQNVELIELSSVTHSQFNKRSTNAPSFGSSEVLITASN